MLNSDFGIEDISSITWTVSFKTFRLVHLQNRYSDNQQSEEVKSLDLKVWRYLNTVSVRNGEIQYRGASTSHFYLLLSRKIYMPCIMMIQFHICMYLGDLLK